MRDRYVGNTANGGGFALDDFFRAFYPLLVLRVADTLGNLNLNDFAIPPES